MGQINDPGMLQTETSPSDAKPTRSNAPPESQAEVTALLLRWRGGDDEALVELTPLVYCELRKLAHAYMKREPSDDLLQTTALINEAFIRLIGMDMQWKCRSHFYSISAQIMRRILVDYARRRRAGKRGGSAPPPLRLGGMEIPAERAEHLVALDDALQDLEKIDSDKSKALELHYFGGMTALEIAEVQEVSQRTVERNLRLARAWIADAMSSAN